MSFLKESLESRMKGYEKAAAHQFHSRNTIAVRVDGVAFHTLTKGFDKPFDERISEAMRRTTYSVHKEIQGCILAYTQSDEATFLLTDLQTPTTQGWFGFKKAKLESVIASMFTYYFNQHLQVEKPDGRSNPAFFDARAFSIPIEDAANLFVWRQKDAYRNFISAVARSTFGHVAVQNKPTVYLKDMLMDHYGRSPESIFGLHHAYGSVYAGRAFGLCTKLDYNDFDNLMTGGILSQPIRF